MHPFTAWQKLAKTGEMARPSKVDTSWITCYNQAFKLTCSSLCRNLCPMPSALIQPGDAIFWKTGQHTNMKQTIRDGHNHDTELGSEVTARVS